MIRHANRDTGARFKGAFNLVIYRMLRNPQAERLEPWAETPQTGDVVCFQCKRRFKPRRCYANRNAHIRKCGDCRKLVVDDSAPDFQHRGQGLKPGGKWIRDETGKRRYVMEGQT